VPVSCDDGEPRRFSRHGSTPRRLAEIAFRAAGSDYGLALAGGYAVRAHERYSREQPLQLAETADAEFDRAMFADTLGALGQISDAAFAPYGADAPAIQRLRQRFADWRNELSQLDRSTRGPAAGRGLRGVVSPRPAGLFARDFSGVRTADGL
jgi:hypothetical protein